MRSTLLTLSGGEHLVHQVMNYKEFEKKKLSFHFLKSESLPYSPGLRTLFMFFS